MIQEDKELIHKDLCARLPYDVMCQTDEHGKIHKLKGINKHKGIWWYEFDGFRNIKLPKPYLRPMSSMTEKEKIDYQAFFNYDGVEYPEEYIDWCNKNHFDYRGLIPIGLALVAPEGMYN